MEVVEITGRGEKKFEYVPFKNKGFFFLMDHRSIIIKIYGHTVEVISLCFFCKLVSSKKCPWDFSIIDH